MKDLVVLGAGTAGTMAANRLVRALDPGAWTVTVVDHAVEHHYQPGYLFVPFGTYRPEDIVKPVTRVLAPEVRFVRGSVERVDTEGRVVELAGGQRLGYDLLIIATGTHPRPDLTPGLDDPRAAEHGVHHFYSLEAATALRDALTAFEGGDLVVELIDLPIKCPVAPLEFTFLVEAWLRERGIREATTLRYVTSLEGAFTKPIAAGRLGGMLAERGVEVVPDFYLERVDVEGKRLVSYDEREVPFDLLVTVPLNMGASFVGRSGLGDDLDHVRVDPGTFLADGHDDVFAVGDAANLPTSKAGSVAHFAVDVLVENVLRHVRGLAMEERFDGHANCFIESGDGQALLIDFNYDTEPLPGSYPLPGVGPLRLLGESAANHWGKLAFRWIYWHVLLPGRPLPLPAAMSMLGKERPSSDVAASTDVVADEARVEVLA